jgi:LPXTG-motif cell wall-anchored protein
MAQEAVTVQLDPVGGSGISGTATLTAEGEGTKVELDIQGLAPGEAARASMHANTCAMPSASFAALPDLQADATGMATATGSVLFRGTDSVPLATMADGEHVIIIQTGQVVACGVIPKLASASVPPALPATGSATPWLTAASVSILGLCALSAGIFLRQRSRPVSRF